MLWDLFCRVIDNHGDVGVCWRLARTLAARGEQVRLWLDDDQALRWMAPWQPGALAPGGIEVRAWAEAELVAETEAAPGKGANLQPGDVVIEAFGCHLPGAFVARMAARQQQGRPPAWVNLEYLSAEAYVERSHGLQSPVMSGPGQGLHKRFFYPGFTGRTGGLLRPASAPSAQEDERPALRQRLLTALGPVANASPTDLDLLHAPWVLAFCYANAPLPQVLDALARQPAAQGWPPVQVWLTPGPATEMGMAWLADRHGAGTASAMDPPMPTPRHLHLHLHTLPHLPQADFDAWLDACDLNLVRGEDSAVRALWPGRPHLWQLYVQEDGVHAEKMHAFADRWMADWPSELRQDVLTWWRLWNGLKRDAKAAPPPDPTHALPVWWAPAGTDASPWMRAQQGSAQALRTQTDLATQLMAFVKQPG